MRFRKTMSEPKKNLRMIDNCQHMVYNANVILITGCPNLRNFELFGYLGPD